MALIIMALLIIGLLLVIAGWRGTTINDVIASFKR
jgi:hypothetical protein